MTGPLTTTTPVETPARRVSRTAWIGLGVAVAIIAAAMLIPALTWWNVHVMSFPPLHADWAPRVGPGTLPAIVLGLAGILYGVDVARRARWPLLLVGMYVVGVGWLAGLALVDGLDGIGVILDTQYEYLRSARAVTDIGAFLQGYIARIPLDAEPHWPVHLAGHPPGAALFFVLLVRLGLGSGLAAGMVVLLIAATTPVAVAITLRRLGAEEGARRAAPFLVLGPAAIWMAVSADAMFGAVAAWGLCALAFSATTRSRGRLAAWGTTAGLLLGYCVMLSYGLPLLGILAIAVLVIARAWRPLPWAAGAAAAVVLAFAAGGFAWWSAYPVLHERYYAGIATRRPFGYWVWGNLATLAISAGPLVGPAVAVAVARLRRIRSLQGWTRVVVLLTLAATATILVADLSGMSKAEVERIWLPFVPWLLVGTALLPERWRRWGLGGQIIFALVVQHLLSTGW